MLNTDVDGIKCVSKGILINTKKNTSYDEQRKRIIMEQRQSDKINNLEHRMSSIETMLNQILNKVTQ